jgi:DeoR family transcriptional regulator, glycerol-3-phosphate regulon repressor
MSAPASRSSKRQSQIITLLRQSGRAAVEDLAAHFSVALQTIRRDLNELSEAGRVVRVHEARSSRRALRTSPTRPGNSSRRTKRD